MKREVTQVETVPRDDASRTTGTIVQVAKFGIIRYRHKDLLLRDSQINDAGISLWDVSDAHVLSHVQSLRAY